LKPDEKRRRITHSQSVVQSHLDRLPGVSASQSCRSGIVGGPRGSTDCACRRIQSGPGGPAGSESTSVFCI
jgi:hypothetical protein